MEAKSSLSSDSKSPWSKTILVGGGPSLRGFDFDKLRGRHVVAINGALLQLPWASAMFSADRFWVSHYREEIKRFEGEKYIAVDPPPDTLLPDVTCLTKIHRAGLSDDPRCVHIIGSSGYAALSLAFAKGAKHITLLGYDFKNPGTHWHANYAYGVPKVNTSFPYWASAFTTTVEILNKHHVTVLNASPDSAITAFQKISLEEV